MFEWFETTPFGYVGKTWGAAFATVQAVHLVGLGVLGGAVIAADGRLLGLLLTDVPANTVVERSHRVFVWALISLLATGIFMACGVAMKIYYLPVYWYKMLALGAGILFHFYIRKPLLAHDIDSLNPVVVKLVHGGCNRSLDRLQRIRGGFAMNDSDNKMNEQKDDETAALLVAQAFIIFSGIYWFLQLESVRELLELAYG
mgnify:CR=1 FL=1